MRTVRPEGAKFIDACRDLQAVAQEGLAKPSASPQNSYVFFATGPNRKASNPSPFAKALTEHIGEPGERIEDIAAEVKADVLKQTSGFQGPEAFGVLSKTVILRPHAKVTLHFGVVDDNAVVTVDGQDVCSDAGACNGREVPLRKGPHPVVVKVFNKDSYTGGFKELGGHQPEGWSYTFWLTDASNQELIRTTGSENRPSDHGPRHGATFPVVTFTLVVDPHTGKVSVTNRNDHAWR